MSKKIIYSAAVAALFSASAVLAGGPEMVMPVVSPFDGFFLGGSASFHHTGFETDTSSSFTNLDPIGPFPPFTIQLASQSGGDSSTDGYYGVRGGWGRVFMNRWYAGVEGFAEFGSANGSVSNTLFPGSAIFTANVTSSVKVSTDYGVAAKLGILLSPTTLAYAKLGAEWADLKSSISATADSGIVAFGPFADSSNSTNSVGFLWGFGLEQFVWKDVVSVFAEYTYVDLGSVTTTDTFVTGTENEVNDTPTSWVTTTNKGSADISSFTGGLNIHFGRNWL